VPRSAASIETFMSNQHLLAPYLGRFAHLNRAPHAKLGRAPHKPVLLLTLLDAVEQSIIKDNFVPISPELTALFRQHWQALVPPGTWHEKMSLPFRHLLHDGF
jgi:putative restriction endonuclease